ncbi:MAG: hypothetical protein HY821_17945 [Acidobacteria bacterium]|nr:hypothetical protein [Acidobacteriota bacterium]
MERRAAVLGMAIQLVVAQGVMPAELEQQSRIIEAAMALPVESPIVVKTRSRESLRGRLKSVDEGTLTMQVAQGNAVTSRTIPFQEITSLKRTDKRMHPATVVLITIGVLWCVGAVAGAALNH